MFCRTYQSIKIQQIRFYKLTGALIVARLFQLLISVFENFENLCQHDIILEIFLRKQFFFALAKLTTSA